MHVKGSLDGAGAVQSTSAGPAAPSAWPYSSTWPSLARIERHEQKEHNLQQHDDCDHQPAVSSLPHNQPPRDLRSRPLGEPDPVRGGVYQAGELPALLGAPATPATAQLCPRLGSTSGRTRCLRAEGGVWLQQVLQRGRHRRDEVAVRVDEPLELEPVP
jgi:hypothetical protein